MINTISYQAAQQLDNAQNNQFIAAMAIAVAMFIIGLIIVLCTRKSQYIGITLVVLGVLLLLGNSVWQFNQPNHTTEVIKRELPTLQKQLEHLKGQRLTAVHNDKPTKEINALDNQIADTQSTINKYNNVIVQTGKTN